VNDENVKYVTKIIENPTILLYLYPNFKQKSSSVIRCFTSATANSEGRLGHDLATGSQITPVSLLIYLCVNVIKGNIKRRLFEIFEF